MDKRYIYNDLFEAVVIKENSGNEQYLTRDINLGGGIGGLISVYDTTDGNVYNHFNHRGDVVNVTNEQESIVSTYYYDAFGSMKLERGQYDSQFRFSTKEYDASTELLYYGFRYYSPKIGRWITKDPIGFYGWINFYSFCRNNPVNFADPYGLYTILGGWRMSDGWLATCTTFLALGTCFSGPLMPAFWVGDVIVGVMTVAPYLMQYSKELKSASESAEKRYGC